MIALCIALAQAAPAAAEEGRFAVSLAGVRAGILSYSAKVEQGRYTARGSARSTGLAGAVLDVSIDTVATGRTDANGYRPETYKQVGREGDRTQEMSFRYRAGVPQVRRMPPREMPPEAAAPHRQRGTLDPVTTAFAMLRDRPEDLMCRLDIDLFDGRRRSNIRYVRLKPQRDGRYLCEGEYRRLQGFSAEEMAERTSWPFTVTYDPLADGRYRVTDIRIPTTFGTMRMRRR